MGYKSLLSNNDEQPPLTAAPTDLKDLEGGQVPGDGVEDRVADFHTGPELCQLLHEGFTH